MPDTRRRGADSPDPAPPCKQKWQEIAEQSGFRTASALVNLFRQRLGMTPKEYRIANRR